MHQLFALRLTVVPERQAHPSQGSSGLPHGGCCVLLSMAAGAETEALMLAGDFGSSGTRRSLLQGSTNFNFGSTGSLLNGINFGSLGLNFGSLDSQITAAILSGNQQQASNLIKQGLQGGNTGAVSKALASASANVGPSSFSLATLA